LFSAGSAAFTAILTFSVYGDTTSAAESVESAAAAVTPLQRLCDLSAVQVSVVQSALQERNASCVYNVSLDAVLGM
jgi:hypothetical protein